MEDTKRVACLYRVSTKIQADENEDIPMQRNACLSFIGKQQGWKFECEYLEPGVSGFKKKADDREILDKLRRDIVAQRFDVLLVYMFDRLGRRDDETPFIAQWIVEQKIELWSVNEGQQKFDSHVDKLINYLRYWQASGESIKTSIRVDESHRQMTKSGEFTGGIAPYGYRLEKSGIYNRKDRELKKLVIDEKEAETVKMIYDLCLNQGMGGMRIAQILNERGIPTRKNSTWGLAVVNYMLRNPIYKGYMTYGKTRSKGKKQGRTAPDEWLLSNEAIPELVIIDEATWKKIQIIRYKRTPSKYNAENIDYNNYPMQTKSSLLFTGFIYCGHCGASLSTGYCRNRWTTKDGISHYASKNVYKCVGRTSGGKCDGQSTYTPEKIEGVVLDEIYTYLDNLRTVDLTKEIGKLHNRSLDNGKKQIKEQKKLCAELEAELVTYKSEIMKSIKGKSAFNPALLSSLIEETTQRLQKEQDNLLQYQEEFEKNRLEESGIRQLQRLIPVWREEFAKASKETKKILLAKIIKRIEVRRDSVKVELRLGKDEFVGKTNPLYK